VNFKRNKAQNSIESVSRLTQAHSHDSHTITRSLPLHTAKVAGVPSAAWSLVLPPLARARMLLQLLPSGCPASSACEVRREADSERAPCTKRRQGKGAGRPGTPQHYQTRPRVHRFVRGDVASTTSTSAAAQIASSSPARSRWLRLLLTAVALVVTLACTPSVQAESIFPPLVLKLAWMASLNTPNGNSLLQGHPGQDRDTREGKTNGGCEVFSLAFGWVCALSVLSLSLSLSLSLIVCLSLPLLFFPLVRFVCVPYGRG
jgi:hypothetical protein